MGPQSLPFPLSPKNHYCCQKKIPIQSLFDNGEREKKVTVNMSNSDKVNTSLLKQV